MHTSLSMIHGVRVVLCQFLFSFKKVKEYKIRYMLSKKEEVTVKVMESLEMSFAWEAYFEPRLHSISLFFANRGRCYRFIKICIDQNPRVPEAWQRFVTVYVACVEMRKVQALTIRITQRGRWGQCSK